LAQGGGERRHQTGLKALNIALNYGRQKSVKQPSKPRRQDVKRNMKSISYRATDSAQVVTIAYADFGQGSTIVMLPSLARSGRDFYEVAQLIAAEGFRVLLPEPRGINGSHGSMDDLTLQDFAADVAAVLDHEKTGPVVVVGHAWGSQPARMLAANRPDLVSAVVMAAASAGKMLPGSQERPYSRLRAEIDGSGDMSLPQERRLACLRKAFFAPGHDPSIWLEGWSQEAHRAQSHARIHTPIDAYFSAGESVPILDLQAEFDAVVIPRVMKVYLGDRVTEEWIKDAGHALIPEQPVALVEAVCRFARSIHAAGR
jgi:pimeloyl-ACP methyl ester carboxylesterase